MSERFPPLPWLRDPTHRTLAEVAETEWFNKRFESSWLNGERADRHWWAKQYLAELRARAVEPERDTAGDAA